MTKHGLVLSSKLVSKTSDIYTNLCLLNWIKLGTIKYNIVQNSKNKGY